MATEAQVLAEMEERGIRTQYDDAEYWGVGEDFENVKNEMERERYEEIKAFLQHPFIGYAGDKLTATASKIHQAALEDEESPVWTDDEGINISYGEYHIHTKNAGWIFEGKTRKFEINDLLAGLCRVDSINQEEVER